ncbi:BZ3500_MvSof-1268-A1-R1_Chr5-1g07631 [Microbotryum saponariae]|uniref:BZ3500_MvSof-1268-A1-R1_Chr5-1g07631 protein n=1 Tax=Microbotryum saponariae TaxID=289078 RepID=A0A2X0ND35_9BASI|nr:BZ3500_MvSof-1268-A1-R1_Chr5-1g07631 [Microbotryum saponariae]SDA05502.1 BZ3501_MvSof-1269-A2-R1_Chr5-2g07455 [Microbotryum saponariae]
MTVDPFSDDYVPPVWDAAHSIPTSGHQTEKALLRIAEVWSDADDGLTEADALLIKTEIETQLLDPAALNFWESQIDKFPLGVELSIESLADADLHPASVFAHALGSSRPADYIASYGSRYWTKNLQSYRLRRQSSAGALSAIQAHNEEDKAEDNVEDAHNDTARPSDLDTNHDGRLIVRSSLFIEGEVPLSALPAGDEATALTALDARYKDDPLFQPLVTFLTTFQFPTGASHSEKGRLRQLARRYAIRAPDVLLFKQGKKTRECIPLHERQQLIEDTHTALNHAGRDLMVVHLSKRFYWPGMAQSVAPVIVTCERCQQFGKRVIRSKLWPITVLAPMDLLAMDYFSLPVSPNKYKSVLVVTDLFSRYVWAFKFKGEGTAKRTIEGLVEIIKTFGTPRILMSDGGTHFKNANVKAFCADKGILRITTPPYAPHTNGAVEGANKRILQAISRATVGSVDATTFSPWCQSLEAVVYAMNNRIIPATGYRPADLMFTFARSMPSEGAPPEEQAIEILAHALTSWADLTLRVACMVADAEGRVSTAYQTMLDAQARRKEAKDRQLQRWNKAIPKDQRDRPFRRGDLVLVHASWLEASRIGGKLQAHWLGPYSVVAPATRTDDAENPSDEHVTFWLESLGDSSPVAGRFHANRLKLFHPPHNFPLPTTEPMTLDEFHAAQRPKRQPPRTQNEDLPGDVLDDDTDTEDEDGNRERCSGNGAN